jgi:hypothetical protein
MRNTNTDPINSVINPYSRHEGFVILRNLQNIRDLKSLKFKSPPQDCKSCEASYEELEQAIGEAKAKLVLDYFNTQTKNTHPKE